MSDREALMRLRAHAGAAWLDEHVRGWRRKIRRRRLDMVLGEFDPDALPDELGYCGCILAQLWPGVFYTKVAQHLGLDDDDVYNLGFSGDVETWAWLEVLREKP